MEGGDVHGIAKPPDQRVSVVQKANAITNAQEQSANEKLSGKKQNANKFDKRNKTVCLTFIFLVNFYFVQELKLLVFIVCYISFNDVSYC